MMDNKYRYGIFSTPKGWVGAMSSALGLVKITLPVPSSEAAIDELEEPVEQALWSPDTFNNLAGRLITYFSGEPVVFPDPVDLSRGTPFQRKVWAATMSIPYGETRSYAWIAHQVGKPAAFRAVGGALGKNPLAIIVPCHRVIASDNTLGGFGGGLEMKKWLLRLESASLPG